MCFSHLCFQVLNSGTADGDRPRCVHARAAEPAARTGRTILCCGFFVTSACLHCSTHAPSLRRDAHLLNQWASLVVAFDLKSANWSSHSLCIAGLLYDRISRDLDWLYTSLDSVLEDDKFTAELVRICKAAYSDESEKPTQQKHLGIFRSDYMLHEPDESTPPKLLQVEYIMIFSHSRSCFGSVLFCLFCLF